MCNYYDCVVSKTDSLVVTVSVVGQGILKTARDFHRGSPTSIAGGLFGATPLYIKGQLAIFELIVA